MSSWKKRYAMEFSALRLSLTTTEPTDSLWYVGFFWFDFICERFFKLVNHHWLSTISSPDQLSRGHLNLIWLWLQTSETSFIERIGRENMVPDMVYPKFCTFIPLSFVYTVDPWSLKKYLSSISHVSNPLTTHLLFSWTCFCGNFLPQSKGIPKTAWCFVHMSNTDVHVNMFFPISTPCQLHTQHDITRFVGFQASFGFLCGAFAGVLKTGYSSKGMDKMDQRLYWGTLEDFSKCRSQMNPWINESDWFIQGTQKFVMNAYSNGTFPVKQIQDCHYLLRSGCKWGGTLNKISDKSPRNINYPWNS